MTMFNDREQGHEQKYAHEAKAGFDEEARCSKLYGLWAAERLGLDGSNAKSYAMEVVEANLEEPGFDDVLRKVRKDFDDKGLDVSDHDMRVALDRALEEARRQMQAEKQG